LQARRPRRRIRRTRLNWQRFTPAGAVACSSSSRTRKRSLYLLPYQPDLHLLLGRIYLRTGRVIEATEALKISLWSRETAEGHAVLGLACLQAKDEAGARSELQKAQRLDPGNADAKELAAKLGTKRGETPADAL